MLRDSGESTPGLRRPYSLARVQMAWWFFLVLGGYMFITLLTGDAVAIPGAVLGLIGISSVTFLSAQLIETSNKATTRTASESAPETEVASQGFLLDVLSNEQGVALHRFQMFVFTVVFGLYFVMKVLGDLVMPDFDVTLLGLMGISSGTYIGAKFPEVPKP